MLKKNNKGFTLVELLVVIAIIGILAVVAVPALFKNIEKGKIADLESDISAIRSAVLSYYTDNSEYPIDNVTPNQSGARNQVTEKVEKTVILGKGQRITENEGTQALLSELEGLSFPYGGSYKLTAKDGASVAKSPATLYLTITTEGSNTTISDSGLDKLEQDLGLEVVKETVDTRTTASKKTGTPTSIFVKADTSAGQIIILPLIKN